MAPTVRLTALVKRVEPLVELALPPEMVVPPPSVHPLALLSNASLKAARTKLGLATVVSTVTLKALLAALRLPAASSCRVVKAYVPSATALGRVKLQAPLPLACTLPTEVPAWNTVTQALASAVPVRVGVLTLVMVSVVSPVLDAKAKAGALGALGAVVSMVKAVALEVTPALLAV